VKTIGLIVVFIYAFFKFAWAYRLFNYVAIMLGAMPFAGDRQTPRPNATSSAPPGCSNRGTEFQPRPARLLLRARLSRLVCRPWELFAATTAVVIVMWRRQFASTAQRAS